jgi:acyl-CoA synthetase (NDP forming)
MFSDGVLALEKAGALDPGHQITASFAFGLAMAERLSRLGIGISTFASAGSKLDVSGNDLLMWWEQDGITKLAVLYLESFGNPRKFARIARRVGQKLPVLTVLPDHDLKTLALFEQAGIVTTPGSGELIETAALLATQPVPAGRTVAVVSNTSGAARLAAGTCAHLGLTVHRTPGMTRRKLRTLIPDTGSVTGPVEVTAEISAEGFRQVVELLADDVAVDAVIALVLPTGATGDLVTAVEQARVSVPVAAVVLGQPESVLLLDGRIPAYATPEAAVTAMARAAGYGARRCESRDATPVPDTDAVRAHDIVRGFLRRHANGGDWLAAGETADLLSCYSITSLGSAEGCPKISVRVSDDHVFGPLVAVDRDGAEQTARFAPLTDADVDVLTGSVRGEPALRDLLLRVSRLADELPEVAELELTSDGARIRLAPYVPQDPFLRRLR